MKLLQELYNVLAVTGYTVEKVMDDVHKKIENLKESKEFPGQTIEEETTYVSLHQNKSQNKVIEEDFPTEQGIFLMTFCENCNIGNPPERNTCVSCGHDL